MKSKAIAGIPFAVFSIAFVAYLVSSGAGLPERPATHFDWQGQPNDWMSRSNYLLVFGSIGLGAAIMIAALCFLVRFFPAGTINIPHRDYWLAPERRAQTFDYVARWGLWAGCLLLVFLAVVHHLVVQANARTPVALPPGIGIISGLFVVILLAWTASLLVHFSKRQSTATGC